MVEPILRWAGSKKKLLPILEQATPKTFSRYIEPFVGSAVNFLRLSPKRALLADLNSDLMGTYLAVRNHPRAVWNRVAAMSKEPEFYYSLRAIDASTLNALDRAARFIYLNRFCFNGVYRTNRQGFFNVPRGSGDLYVPEYRVFLNFSRSLQATELWCGDFESIVSKARKEDFLYLDPPYALGTKRDRGEYGSGSFKDIDESRLAGVLEMAASRGAKVLLSYSPSPFLLHRLKGWNVHPIAVNRSVAGFASSRRMAQEVLMSNYSWTAR
ncbi:Dam family site-specific DNA-(adenine-N6)-methyltransferase [Roseateles sp.]|uniref:DNA adenine methylase n=1 Tax=Roseateles sp. TaxID=1971397 RepID=UPI002F404CA9